MVKSQGLRRWLEPIIDVGYTVIRQHDPPKAIPIRGEGRPRLPHVWGIRTQISLGLVITMGDFNNDPHGLFLSSHLYFTKK